MARLKGPSSLETGGGSGGGYLKQHCSTRLMMMMMMMRTGVSAQACFEVADFRVDAHDDDDDDEEEVPRKMNEDERG